MKIIKFLTFWFLFSFVLALSLSAQETNGLQAKTQSELSSTSGDSDDYSKFFIHEVVDGKYGLIKNVQNGVEVILRPDRIEIFKSANPHTGAHEVSTYLLFSDVNTVEPIGQDLVESSKVRVLDRYDDATVQYLKSEYLKVNKYDSVIYPNLYDGVDMEVSLNKKGEVIFSLIPKNGSVDIPFGLKVWDSNATAATNGVISNGVKVTSDSSDLSIKNEKISFKSNTRSQAGYSFKLDINNSSL